MKKTFLAILAISIIFVFSFGCCRALKGRLTDDNLVAQYLLNPNPSA